MNGNCEEKGTILFNEGIINVAKREVWFEAKTFRYRCLSFFHGKWRCSGCRMHLCGWIKLCFQSKSSECVNLIPLG